MNESYGERATSHHTALSKFDRIIQRCEKCGGMGYTKKKILNKIGSPRGNAKVTKEQRRKEVQQAVDHAKKEGYNPASPPLGLCECRLLADRLKAMTIGGFPVSSHNLTFKDINQRDITIVNQRTKVDVRKFLRFYMRRFQQARENGLGMNFIGGYGYGKTFAAHVLGAQVVERRYNVHYTPFFLLLDQLSSGGNIGLNLLLREILSVDFLIIDDIGNENEFRRRSVGELAYLLKERTSQKKVNVFIFNKVKKIAEITDNYDSLFHNVCTERNMDVHFTSQIVNQSSTKKYVTKFLHGLG